MMLVEETLVPETALPVAMLKQHLRLGTGFGVEELQEPLLASFLRAALAAIEARTGKALIAREFTCSFSQWRAQGKQVMPIAPVQSITTVQMIDAYGGSTLVEPSRYALRQEGMQSVIVAGVQNLPHVPSGTQIEVRFRAGFGDSFAMLPADLQQAVMLLAAHYYEYRDETALVQGCMPFGVTSLIARYRPLRLGMMQ